MSLSAAIALLQTAMFLLALAQSSPSVPQSVIDNAIEVAQHAIVQAQAAIASSGLAVPATNAPSVTLTQPTSGSVVVIGQNIPIAWSYTNAPRNAQMEVELSLVQQASGSMVSGSSGGSWISPLINMGPGTGSHSWSTGVGRLEIPGTYSLSAKMRECDPQGCNYSSQSFTPATYARSRAVTFTVGAPSGQLSVSATSGSAPLTVSFQWFRDTKEQVILDTGDGEHAFLMRALKRLPGGQVCLADYYLDSSLCTSPSSSSLPTVTYTKPGTYVVMLKDRAGGFIDTATITVR